MPMTAAMVSMTANQPIIITPFIMIMSIATMLALAIGLGILFAGMIKSSEEMKEFNKKIGFTKETEEFIKREGLDK